MNNLNKDIEILKEVQAIFEHLKNHGWVKDITKEVDIDKVIQAIEKVLWALNGKDCVIETQSHNKELKWEFYGKDKIIIGTAIFTLEELQSAVNNKFKRDKEKIKKQDKELETYKKIAEKLAEEWFDFDKLFMIRGKDIHSAKQLLDLARKEVENGNNN